MYWLVLYHTNMGFVYGWVTKATRVSDAEEEFWRNVDTVSGKSILCIAQLDFLAMKAFFDLYHEDERG